MKKNYVLIIYSIALAVLFILTGAFAVGTTAAPQTYWLASVKEWQDEIENSGFTLELDRGYKVKGEDGNEETKYHDIKDVYLYIGKVYSYNANGKVDIALYFKTKSSGETSYDSKKEVACSDSYCWVKVYDGETDGTISERSRIKITSPQMFELCEVAVVAEDGSLIKISGAVSESETTKSSAEKVFDEQSTFTSSKAYIYNLTDEEREELKSADALFGGGEAVGRAPLSTLLNAVSVLIFGRSTFGIRFFSLLAGYFSLIILYLLIRRLFADDFAALFGSLSALFACALLSGAVTATALISLPFILLAYYSAIGFYAERYKFSPRWAGIRNLLICGVFIALSVSAGASNIIALAGIPVIWGFAIFKLNKEYKKEYEAAKGLEKETVYFAYHKKTATCAWAFPLAFIVLPIATILLFYAITGKQITAVYGEFFGGVMKDISKSFALSGSLSRFGLLIGYGSEKAGNANRLINYLPHFAALFGLVLTTLAAALQKTEKFKPVWRGIKNKYVLTTIIFLAAYLPLLIGINLSVSGASLFTCAYVIYILLGLVAIEKTLGKSVFKWTAIVIAALSFITFAGCYFGLFGFEISEPLKNILYSWQV